MPIRANKDLYKQNKTANKENAINKFPVAMRELCFQLNASICLNLMLII